MTRDGQLFDPGPGNWREHLQKAHGFTESDFGMFGDDPSPRMLEGMHGQEHDYRGDVGHSHGETAHTDVFHDRRKEGRRHKPTDGYPPGSEMPIGTAQMPMTQSMF